MEKMEAQTLPSIDAQSFGSESETVTKDGYWTTAEAAEFLGKSERTVRRLLQSGKVKGYKTIGPYGAVWRVEPIAGCLSNDGYRSDAPEANSRSGALILKLDERVEYLSAKIEQETAMTVEAPKLPVDCQRNEDSSASGRDSSAKPGWWHFFQLPAKFRFKFISP